MIDHKKLREALMQKCAALQVQETEFRNRANDRNQERMGIMYAVDELDRLIEFAEQKAPKPPVGSMALDPANTGWGKQ